MGGSKKKAKDSKKKDSKEKEKDTKKDSKKKEKDTKDKEKDTKTKDTKDKDSKKGETHSAVAAAGAVAGSQQVQAVHESAAAHAAPAVAQHQDQAQTQRATGESKIAVTISAAEAKACADGLRNAMKGLGTNEKMIIENIGNKTTADMQLVIKAYQDGYSRDLVADLKSECGGNFLSVVLAMCTPPADMDAQLIKKAIAGIGTDESLLSEVLCTRSPSELKAAGAAYQRLYNKNMEADIKSDTGGDLARVYMQVLSPSRGTRNGDPTADIEALYKAGAGKIGTDEATFITIIASASPAYLEALFYGYAQKCGNSLDTVIRDEMGGDLGKALANLALPPHVLFSERILKSMKGVGTEDEKLIRLLTTQRGRYLKAAGKHFLEVNRKTISAWVGDECSGDYKALLLKMCAAEGV